MFSFPSAALITLHQAEGAQEDVQCFCTLFILQFKRLLASLDNDLVVISCFSHDIKITIFLRF